ncbi:hypothetical protein VTO42DRAFT_7287 [Malbranchea cinnamomea]
MLQDIQSAPSLELAATGVTLFLLYRVYHYLTVGAARRRMIEESGCKPPLVYPYSGPFGLRLGWFMRQRGKEGTILQTIQERFRDYGNTMYLTIVGEKVINSCDPENIKTVLSLKFSDWHLPPSRKKPSIPLLGEGIFMSDGAHWEHSRAMLRPSFTRSQVADLNIFERHIQVLISAIPTDGSTVDLQDLFFDLTLDTSTEHLFGKSADTLSDRLAGVTGENFSDFFTHCMHWIGQRVRFGFLAGPVDAKYRRGQKFIHNFADRFVQQALAKYHAVQSGVVTEKKPEERYVFLDELVKQTQDPLVLRSEALNILLAGRDTTASLLGALWHTLARRPDAWAKLQAEVDDLNGRKPTFEEMKNMKYLRYCINETLRLYPVVPGNSRIAIRDTVLPRGGGPDGKSPIFVPKGTNFAYSVYAMHRREDLYGPDAAEFKPERWETIRPGWEYLPFNGGPRICLGQQFALTEASYTTVRLMQNFRTIECRDPNPWREMITLTCASYHGTKVALGK